MGRKRKLQKKKKSAEIAKQGNDTNGADMEDSPAPPLVVILLDQILSNHLIMDEILQNCSHADLLEFSLVSKSWNSSARAYLWRQRNTLLSLRPVMTVKELEGIAELMENNILGGNQPFRGIMFEINEDTEYPFNAKEDFQEILDNRKLLQRILAKMATDHVTVTQSHHFTKYSRSLSIQNDVNRVYRNYATALLVDTITSLDFSDLLIYCVDFVKPFRETKLPHLKFINIHPGLFVNHDFCTGDDTRKLSALCPALEWHNPLDLHDLFVFLELGIVSHVKFLTILESDLSWTRYEENIVRLETEGPRLKRLLLNFKPVKNIAVTVPRIIKSSRDSLEEIWIDYHVLQEFQHYQGFPCLTNVRKLHCVYKEEDGAKIFQEGTNSCLQHIFPKAILKYKSSYAHPNFSICY